MNGLATVVAAYGLLSDSTAVVIGAMVIATLLGPITGIALALVDGDVSLLRKALTSEVKGVLLVLAVSLAIGRLHHDIPLGKELLARTSPNILDLAIALAGGAAGAYASISPRVSAGIVGVAIATALVPPLSACGICLAHGETKLAFGSFLLFFVNFVAIQFASSLVLWLHGYHLVTRLSRDDEHRLLLRNVPSVILLLILAGALGLNLRHSLAAQRLETAVRSDLTRDIASHPGSFLAGIRISQDSNRTVVVAVLRTPFSFSPQEVKVMQSTLPKVNPPIELHVRSVLTKEATEKGWLHEPPSPDPQVLDGG